LLSILDTGSTQRCRYRSNAETPQRLAGDHLRTSVRGQEQREGGRVTGRQALVVGGSSEIGAAIAAELSGVGYGVALWGRDEGRLRASADACRAGGGHATYTSLDVTDAAAARLALHEVVSRGSLSVVVWAAGLFDWASADQADPDAWRTLLDVNLTAAAVITTLVLPPLVEAAPSALVYIGSGASRQVFANNAAYVASKHGLAGLAGATFLDVRDRDVKVSLVSPGLVSAGAGLLSDAGQHRPHHLLTAADVAAAVRFVVTFPGTGCPTEVRLEPQRTP
jgi:NADP-dependent 3-hydroxy acid dehydrogenase YdfG